MLFSIVTTIVLQEMAARLGFVTQKGLGEAINSTFSKGVFRYLVFFLIISAILVGNGAYEAGNISGGVLGLQLTIGELKIWPLLIGIISFLLLFYGRYKVLERIFIGLVILMSLCFFITVVIVKPDFVAVFKGFIPSDIISVNYLHIMGLIGTTVVPYNLFLHAATISKKWKPGARLKDIRVENTASIIIGGLISMLIIITAVAAKNEIVEISSAKDLAIQLEPLFGVSAKLFMGIGLLAAGLSSTLTAPIAAAYVARGLFNWSDDEKDIRFRGVWMLIIVVGVFIAMIGIKPIKIIQFAQITNAILLPFIAMYLLYVSNSKKLLGDKINSTLINVLGVLVILITLLLSLMSLNRIFNFL